MVFIGEPGLTVMDSRTRRFLFKFDASGEFGTNDPALITRLQARFKVKEEKKPPKRKVKNNGK
jgi:hypothetical protein